MKCTLRRTCPKSRRAGCGATVGSPHHGLLVLRGAELTNKDGAVLVLDDVEAKTVFLPVEIVCPRCGGIVAFALYHHSKNDNDGLSSSDPG
jgi:hypothetical protein